MKFVFIILKEQLRHFNLIVRMANYEIKGRYQGHYLGVLWQFLNPFLQVLIFWVTFGVGIRHGAPVDGTPYLLWLLCGLIPWFFLSPTIIQGSNSIYTKVNLVSKMKFPVSVLPTITLVGNAISFGFMFVILLMMMVIDHVPITFYFIQVPYYFLCMIVLLFSFNILSSTITAMVRDYQLVLQSFMRMLLYLSPVLWNVNSTPKLATLMKINPLFYIIQGFRDSILSKGFFVDDPYYTLYFWSLTLLILLIGSITHIKFRDKFVDYL